MIKYFYWSYKEVYYSNTKIYLFLGAEKKKSAN